MNLKKWALVAEVFGGLGIVISIVYLAVEVSRNTANTEVSNHLVIVGQLQNLRMVTIESSEFSDIRLRGDADLANLDDIERLRYSDWAFNSLDLWESAFVMYDRGAIAEQAWAVYDSGWCSFFRDNSGIQQIFFELQDTSFFTEFAAHANSCLKR
jgi:hypothetical protein